MKGFVVCIIAALLICIPFSVAMPETEVTINKGWNLVYGFFETSQLNDQPLDKSNILAIFVFLPGSQQYAQAFPNIEEEKIGREAERDGVDSDHLLYTAAWVYSNKAMRTEYWLGDIPKPVNERPMFKGWNFVGITQDFEGKSMNDLKGNCEITKAYYWDSAIQNWTTVDLSMKIENSATTPNMLERLMFTGMVVKVASACTLGESQVVASPPQIPS